MASHQSCNKTTLNEMMVFENVLSEWNSQESLYGFLGDLNSKISHLRVNI